MTRVVDGEPIAIFGVSLDKMADIANVDPDTPFVNAFETAKNTVRAIQKSGINKIILVSHLGFDSDCELAKEVDDISLIVGGHSHTFLGDFSDLGLKKNLNTNIRLMVLILFKQDFTHRHLVTVTLISQQMVQLALSRAKMSCLLVADFVLMQAC